MAGSTPVQSELIGSQLHSMSGSTSIQPELIV